MLSGMDDKAKGGNDFQEVRKVIAVATLSRAEFVFFLRTDCQNHSVI